jgi:hypothetical protein
MNKIKLSINETTLELFPIPATNEFLSHYNIYVNGKKTDYELIFESSQEDNWVTLYDEVGDVLTIWENESDLSLDMVVNIYKTIIKK